MAVGHGLKFEDVTLLLMVRSNSDGDEIVVGFDLIELAAMMLLLRWIPRRSISCALK